MRRQTVGKAARSVHAGARAFHPLVGMQEKDRDGEFIIVSFAVFFPCEVAVLAPARIRTSQVSKRGGDACLCMC